MLGRERSFGKTSSPAPAPAEEEQSVLGRERSFSFGKSARGGLEPLPASEGGLAGDPDLQ